MEACVNFAQVICRAEEWRVLVIVFWLFLFLWPCDELTTCPGCHPGVFVPLTAGTGSSRAPWPRLQEEVGPENGWINLHLTWFWFLTAAMRHQLCLQTLMKRTSIVHVQASGSFVEKDARTTMCVFFVGLCITNSAYGRTIWGVGGVKRVLVGVRRGTVANLERYVQ